MANIMSMVCPVDGLEFNLAFLQPLTNYMATWEVGHANSFYDDTTVQCANGHKWAMNFKVAFTRVQ